MNPERKKVNVLTLKSMKERGEKVVYLTSYDYPFALLTDRAGVDMILVGDSLAMTVLGHSTTLPVTMDEMISHAKAVTRAVKRAFVIGDMPYMSYQPSDRDAVLNAGRFIAEGSCDAVKLEGGRRVASRVKALVEAGILVQGHLGLTPQNMAQLGGYRVQGKTQKSYEMLLEDALALQEAGAFSLLLEGMPSPTAQAIKEKLSIPVYGIGAGDQMDGQLLIIHDVLGLFEQFTPKFVKRYLEGGTLIAQALERYCQDVRTGEFPKAEHFYSMESNPERPILGQPSSNQGPSSTQPAAPIRNGR